MCTPLRIARLLAPILLLAACEPPPEVTVAGEVDSVEPSLRLLFPEDQAELTLDPDDCSLQFDVVVDIDNLDIVDPSTVDEEVDGEGHWHLYVNGDKVTAKAEVQRFDSNDFQKSGLDYVGSLEIEGELQSNRHNPLEEFTNFADRIEITVRAGDACPTE